MSLHITKVTADRAAWILNDLAEDIDPRSSKSELYGALLYFSGEINRLMQKQSDARLDALQKGIQNLTEVIAESNCEGLRKLAVMVVNADIHASKRGEFRCPFCQCLTGTKHDIECPVPLAEIVLKGAKE
jgi:hypothetical protein